MPISSSSSIKPTTQGFDVLLIESDKKSLQHHAYVLLQNSYRALIPKRFFGLRVLLVESDKKLLKLHADVLKKNSYQVTTTTEASNGLSMMMNGHTYDCVLIDVDMYETETEAFLHQVLRHQPQMSIILMASDDIHLRIKKEALESEAVLCLLKPCSPRDICDIWKHICRNRISFQENDNMAISNNILSGNFTNHQELDCSSQENESVLKKVTYEDLFSDDDDDDDDDNDREDVNDIATKENVGIGTMKKTDKGKQLVMRKKKNDELVENFKYPKKRKVIKTRVTWKGELDEQFQNALKELGKQAHSKAILKHMNVPGLTRFHVASHLQKYQTKQKRIEDSIAALTQRGNNLQLESFANIKRPESIQSNDDAYNIQSSSIMRSSWHNLAGISYMIIDNIRAKLQEAPQLTTNTLNNKCDNQATDHSFGVVESSNISSHDHHDFGEAMGPLGFGETLASTDYNLAGKDIKCLFSDLDIGNFGDAGGGENMYPVSSHSASTLFDVENRTNDSGSSLDSIIFGAEFCIPEFQTEEKGSPVNSIFPLDGSERVDYK